MDKKTFKINPKKLQKIPKKQVKQNQTILNFFQLQPTSKNTNKTENQQQFPSQNSEITQTQPNNKNTPHFQITYSSQKSKYQTPNFNDISVISSSKSNSLSRSRSRSQSPNKKTQKTQQIISKIVNLKQNVNRNENIIKKDQLLKNEFKSSVNNQVQIQQSQQIQLIEEEQKLEQEQQQEQYQTPQKQNQAKNQNSYQKNIKNEDFQTDQKDLENGFIQFSNTNTPLKNQLQNQVENNYFLKFLESSEKKQQKKVKSSPQKTIEIEKNQKIQQNSPILFSIQNSKTASQKWSKISQKQQIIEENSLSNQIKEEIQKHDQNSNSSINNIVKNKQSNQNNFKNYFKTQNENKNQINPQNKFQSIDEEFEHHLNNTETLTEENKKNQKNQNQFKINQDLNESVQIIGHTTNEQKTNQKKQKSAPLYLTLENQQILFFKDTKINPTTWYPIQTLQLPQQQKQYNNQTQNSKQFISEQTLNQLKELYVQKPSGENLVKIQANFAPIFSLLLSSKLIKAEAQIPSHSHKAQKSTLKIKLLFYKNKLPYEPLPSSSSRTFKIFKKFKFQALELLQKTQNLKQITLPFSSINYVSEQSNFDPVSQIFYQNQDQQQIQQQEENQEIFESLIQELTPKELRVQLKVHQQSALVWMAYREQALVQLCQNKQNALKVQNLLDDYYNQNNIEHPLWSTYQINDENEKIYVNKTTGQISCQFPYNFQLNTKGGILADEMGLGKTLSMLCLILNHKKPKNKLGTLVVLPLSLLNNWQKEIEDQFDKNSISYYVFYNKNSQNNIQQQQKLLNLQKITKKADNNEEKLNSTYFNQQQQNNLFLSKFDLVLTTYETLVQHQKKIKQDPNSIRSSQIYAPNVQWHRIILDEGHLINNLKTQKCQAIQEINANFHWVITGTPFQNKVLELYPILNFIQHQPWNHLVYYNQIITDSYTKTSEKTKEKNNQLQQNQQNQFQQNQPQEQEFIEPQNQQNLNKNQQKIRKLLSNLLLPVTLRRTKISANLNLPQKHIQTIEVVLKPHEQDLYDALSLKSQNIFEGFLAKGKIPFMQIFTLLLRLRQQCNHWSLLNSSFSKQYQQFHKQINAEISENIAEFQYYQLNPEKILHQKNLLISEINLDKKPQNPDKSYPKNPFQNSSKNNEKNTLQTQIKEIFQTESPYIQKIPYQIKTKIENLHQNNNYELCMACLNPLNDHLIVTECLHIFCADCFPQKPQIENKILDSQNFYYIYKHPKCPLCKELLSQQDFLNQNKILEIQIQRPLQLQIQENQNNKNDYPKLLNKVKQQTGRTVLRKINHPKYKQSNYSTAVEYLKDKENGEFVIRSNQQTSSKQEKIIEQIKKIKSRFPNDKIIIFTQFRGMISLLEKSINENFGLQATTNPLQTALIPLVLHGSIPSNQRLKILQQFSSKNLIYQSEPILISSLKVGNVGLNLTTANHILIVDNWWNPWTEVQAMDRIHRIGQSKDCYIYKFIVKNSVEERIEKIKKRKFKLVNGTLGEQEIQQQTKKNQQKDREIQNMQDQQQKNKLDQIKTENKKSYNQDRDFIQQNSNNTKTPVAENQQSKNISQLPSSQQNNPSNFTQFSAAVTQRLKEENSHTNVSSFQNLKQQLEQQKAHSQLKKKQKLMQNESRDSILSIPEERDMSKIKQGHYFDLNQQPKFFETCDQDDPCFQNQSNTNINMNNSKMNSSIMNCSIMNYSNQARQNQNYNQQDKDEGFQSSDKSIQSQNDILAINSYSNLNSKTNLNDSRKGSTSNLMPQKNNYVIKSNNENKNNSNNIYNNKNKLQNKYSSQNTLQFIQESPENEENQNQNENQIKIKNKNKNKNSQTSQSIHINLNSHLEQNHALSSQFNHMNLSSLKTKNKKQLDTTPQSNKNHSPTPIHKKSIPKDYQSFKKQIEMNYINPNCNPPTNKEKINLSVNDPNNPQQTLSTQDISSNTSPYNHNINNQPKQATIQNHKVNSQLNNNQYSGQMNYSNQSSVQSQKTPNQKPPISNFQAQNSNESQNLIKNFDMNSQQIQINPNQNAQNQQNSILSYRNSKTQQIIPKQKSLPKQNLLQKKPPKKSSLNSQDPPNQNSSFIKSLKTANSSFIKSNSSTNNYYNSQTNKNNNNNNNSNNCNNNNNNNNNNSNTYKNKKSYSNNNNSKSKEKEKQKIQVQRITLDIHQIEKDLEKQSRHQSTSPNPNLNPNLNPNPNPNPYEFHNSNYKEQNSFQQLNKQDSNSSIKIHSQYKKNQQPLKSPLKNGNNNNQFSKNKKQKKKHVSVRFAEQDQEDLQSLLSTMVRQNLNQYYQYYNEQSNLSMSTLNSINSDLTLDSRTFSTENDQIQIDNYVYRETDIIGEGIYSQTYKCENLDTKRMFALKKYPQKAFQNSKLKDISEQDAQNLPYVKSNNLVRIEKIIKQKNYVYIIQELQYQSLYNFLLTQPNHMQELTATTYMMQIIQGLKDLLSCGYNHRDLKPQNIFIDQNNFLKLSDYNLVNQPSILLATNGSPKFMAPEIIQGQSYTIKSDIWSLGCLYYYMLFKQTPWPSKEIKTYLQQTLSVPLQFPYIMNNNLNQENFQISQKAIEFITGCLQINPNDRFTWSQVVDHPLFQEQNFFKKTNLNGTQNEKPIFSKESQQALSQIQNYLKFQNFIQKELCPSIRYFQTRSIFHDIHTNDTFNQQQNVVIPSEFVTYLIEYNFQNYHEPSQMFLEEIKLIMAVNKNSRQDFLGEFQDEQLQRTYGKLISQDKFHQFLNQISNFTFSKQEAIQFFQLIINPNGKTLQNTQKDTNKNDNNMQSSKLNQANNINANSQIEKINIQKFLEKIKN
ncbi:Protein kinase-like domain [Pseudocohnilembus persalinus]|uniref:Protein kinase-like domain n=1 Tax=Pseudocohnilembus persalinus TaxID=266149 RepID=A0A0V0QUM2_PSEPJ|nr:Protein kinase-like domain [Pseudocohnilembus persalinus]|eukprot:KRX06115.1 Protein kinase-like domain [Pseudocohnilembus persalinus]